MTRQPIQPTSGRIAAPQSPREVLALADVTRPAISLEALVFDLGNVLYDASPWQRWLLQLLNRVGLHTHYHVFFRVFEREYLPAVYRGERDYWDALAHYLRASGMSRGRIEEVLAAGHGKYRELWDDVRPLPGVQATLLQLAQRGVRLAVLSNSGASAARLLEKLAHLGLAGRFAVVLSSRDMRRAKPDPESYQAVLEACGAKAGAVGFVGHETCELAGAGLAGMMTFAIHHRPDAQADIYLDRFDQLLQVTGPAYQNQRAG